MYVVCLRKKKKQKRKDDVESISYAEIRRDAGGHVLICTI